MSFEDKLDSMGVDELEALLKDPTKIEALTEEEAAPPEAPEPEATPPPAEPPPPEPAPAVAEPVEEDTSDLALLKAEWEAEKLANEQRLKALERKLGHQAGEAGYWKQKFTETSKAAPVEDDDEPQPEPVAAAPKREAPKADPITTWAVSTAINQTSAAFKAQHAELTEAALREYLDSIGYEPSQLLTVNDPLEAARQTTLLLEEAYLHTQAKSKAARLAELQEKRASQVKLTEEAKRKATISGSGAPPPPRESKTYQEMSVEELSKELNRLTR